MREAVGTALFVAAIAEAKRTVPVRFTQWCQWRFALVSIGKPPEIILLVSTLKLKQAEAPVTPLR